VPPKWFLRLWCIRRKLCTYLAMKLKLSLSWIPYDTRHLGVPLGASKLISEHILCSLETVHLSCIKISTISKQTKSSFHLSPFAYEYHRVHPKWFLSPWRIWHKLCTYFASKLTLSLNRPKRDSIKHTSCWSSNGCVQIDFRVHDMFLANRAPILHQD